MQCTKGLSYHALNGFLWNISALIITSSLVCAHADVLPTVDATGTGVSMKNNTPTSWALGGIRFTNGGFSWTGNDNGFPTSYFAIRNIPRGTNKEVDLYFKSNAPGYNTSKLAPATTRTFNHPWSTNFTGAVPVAGSEFLLLRTGSSGVPDDPIGEVPITLVQLDSLSKLPDFYRTTYRYSAYDSLGVKGGKYSGGFLDTWLGETQVQFAIPTNGFDVNMTPTSLDTVNLPKFHWMAMALGQEYLNVDMQWMAAMAAKESFSGTMHYLDSYLNQGGVYSPWHVENATGLDRAMAYPNFFPKYQVQLASAPDVASSGISPDVFLTYYTRKSSGTTVLNSATTVSAMLVSIFVQFNNYDVFAVAADICWKEALDISREFGDPFLGLAAMVASYNLGQWSQIGNASARMRNSVVGTNARLPAPQGRNLFPPGNGDYRNQIINVAQAFTNASRQSLTNSSVKLLDFQITRQQFMDVFFGEGGSVAAQGDGGLLRNFYENNAAVQRQQIWNKLDSAFTILEGRAPSTTGTQTVSYRYDFLGILRTVKGMMAFNRGFRAAGDASILIPLHSTIGGCSGIPLDEIYPYISYTTRIDPVNDDFIVTLKVTDETEAKDMKWTLSYKWDLWNTVSTPLAGATKQQKTFEARITKAQVQNFLLLGDGQSGHYVWIMGNDLSGNSTIRKLPVTYKVPTTLDSAAAFDATGDGAADAIRSYLTPGNNPDISKNFEKVSYAWPNTTPLVDAMQGDVKISFAGTILTVADATLTSGAGLGAFSINVDTAYTIYDPATQVGKWVKVGPVDVQDRVGPALFKGVALLKAKINPGNDDSLVVSFTEPVREPMQVNTIYLRFDPDGPVASKEASKVSGNQWIFTFPSGTVEGNDSVNLVHTGGICDTLGNIPLVNNQKIPITLRPGLYTVSGDYLDTDGDGTMDSIAMKFDRSVDDPGKLSFTFEWPDNSGAIVTMKVKGGDCTVTNGTNVGWKVQGYSLKQYITSIQATWGKATLTQPVPDGSSMTTGPITIKDGMAPVITEARYYSFNSSSVKDTLKVTFSENVGGFSNAQSFKFRTPSVPEYLIDAASTSLNATEATFYVVTLTSGITPASADSIWIYASHGVKDNLGTEQAVSLNKKQPLSVYRTYNLLTAAYLDTSTRADGYIDIVRVTMSAVPAQFDFTKIADAVKLPAARLFDPLSEASFTATASGFDIRVRQSGIPVDKVSTSVSGDDVLEIATTCTIGSDGILAATKQAIQDSLAPVITYAFFSPAVINESNFNKDVPDILEIRFSEVIKKPSTATTVWPEPFAFCTKNGAGDKFQVTVDLVTNSPAKEVVFHADTVLKSQKRYFPINGDSLWIVANAEITDITAAANMQKRHTKPIPLSVGKYEYLFRLIAYPNPFSAGALMAEKAKVCNTYGLGTLTENQVAILLIPYGYVPADKIDFTATNTIFDAIGNSVLDKGTLQFNKKESNQAWYYIWDTKNSQARSVGSGSYLCVTTVNGDNSSVKSRYWLMVGIKK
jgi:hypothetical protein